MPSRRIRPGEKRRKKKAREEDKKRGQELRDALRRATKKLPAKVAPGGGQMEDLKIMKTNFSGDKKIRHSTPQPSKRVGGFGVA